MSAFFSSPGRRPLTGLIFGGLGALLFGLICFGPFRDGPIEAHLWRLTALGEPLAQTVGSFAIVPSSDIVTRDRDMPGPRAPDASGPATQSFGHAGRIKTPLPDRFLPMRARPQIVDRDGLLLPTSLFNIASAFVVSLICAVKRREL